MMERRFEDRPALRIGVRRRDRSGRARKSETRNITADGAFVETDGGDFACADVLWIELPDPEVAGGWTSMAALVVHRHSDGLGLMFSHPYTALGRADPSHAGRKAA